MIFCLHHYICVHRMQWSHISSQEVIELGTLEGLMHAQLLYLFEEVGF